MRKVLVVLGVSSALAWLGVGCGNKLVAPASTTASTNASSGVGGGAGGQGGAKPVLGPTFAEVYTQVLRPHGCVGSYCHSEWSAGGEGVQATYLGLVRQASKEKGCEGQVLVVPGDVENSLLFSKVSSTTPPCGNPMPASGVHLTSDDTAMIAAWIEGGARE